MNNTSNKSDTGSRRETLLRIAGVAAAGVAATSVANAQFVSIPAASSPIYASWIHGNEVRVEEPNTLTVKPRGFHAEIYINSSPAWFHIAIPTPVVKDGARMRVTRVMLNFKTELYGINVLGAPPPAITQIAVWDGPNFLAQVNQIAWSGEHTFEPINIPNAPSV